MGRGAELNCQVRSAPRLVQRSAATVALTAHPCQRLKRVPKTLPQPPSRGLTRWVHRDLPSPPLRCALIPLRSGDGSLLWTIGTTRRDQSKTLSPPNKRGSSPPSTGVEYQSRSGLIALLNRLGMEHRKPKAISRKLDPQKQVAFIKAYENLLNQLEADETVIFADAVHPTHAVRPVGCWAPKEMQVAVEQSSGRDRLNVHGAINLETGQTIMKDVLTVDAASTILLLMEIEAMYPRMRLIHVFLDNARYHHAILVQAWLALPDRRIKLHFIPVYCPHLNPIERLWGLMHRHITHNKCYASFREFSTAMLNFLRRDVPENWNIWCDEVTDNFRTINPIKFRILT